MSDFSVAPGTPTESSQEKKHKSKSNAELTQLLELLTAERGRDYQGYFTTLQQYKRKLIECQRQ